MKKRKNNWVMARRTIAYLLCAAAVAALLVWNPTQIVTVFGLSVVAAVGVLRFIGDAVDLYLLGKTFKRIEKIGKEDAK